MKIPNPGSTNAQIKGCVCPVHDNNYGEGVTLKGKQVFWMSSECPLHGWESRNNRPYKLGEKEAKDEK